MTDARIINLSDHRKPKPKLQLASNDLKPAEKDDELERFLRFMGWEQVSTTRDPNGAA